MGRLRLPAALFLDPLPQEFFLLGQAVFGIHAGLLRLDRQVLDRPVFLRIAAEVLASQGKEGGGVQITHGGGKTSRAVIGTQPLAPSDGVLPNVGTDVARALTLSDLDALEECYIAAARRVVEAGFDFVEVHGAHGYLLSEFLSPLANRRTDEYGGSLENRLRFPLRMVKAVRRVVGGDFLVLYRLGGSDYMPGGLTEAEGQQAAQALVAAGVDLLDVSGGLCDAALPGWDGQSQGYFVPLAAGIKAAVKVPVIAVGGITDPVFADRVVRSGQVDLVGIGRAMLKNPDWASEARAALA